MADQVDRGFTTTPSDFTSADFEIPPARPKGVIVAEADHVGGFSLVVKDGRLRHPCSLMGVCAYRQGTDAHAGELAEPELVALLATQQVSSPRSTLARS